MKEEDVGHMSEIETKKQTFMLCHLKKAHPKGSALEIVDSFWELQVGCRGHGCMPVPQAPAEPVSGIRRAIIESGLPHWSTQPDARFQMGRQFLWHLRQKP